MLSWHINDLAINECFELQNYVDYGTYSQVRELHKRNDLLNLHAQRLKKWTVPT
jgi:hypothetical protein